MLSIVLPAKGIRALGWVYVWGRNFVPAPATGIIAFIALVFNTTCKGHEVLLIIYIVKIVKKILLNTCVKRGVKIVNFD